MLRKNDNIQLWFKSSIKSEVHNEKLLQKILTKVYKKKMSENTVLFIAIFY